MKLDRKPREGNKSYWGRNKKTHMTRKQKGGADGRRSRWEGVGKKMEKKKIRLFENCYSET